MNLQQQYQVDWLKKNLFQQALKFLELDREQKKDLKQNLNNQEFISDFLIEFFNLDHGREDGKYKHSKKRYKNFEETENRGKQFLLVLDNCQEIIE